MTAFAMVVPSATAATYTVTVSISAITAIDAVDSTNEADFYWRVALNGVWRNSPQIYVNDNTYTTPWSAQWSLSGGSGQTYLLILEVWDDDKSSMDFTYSYSANENDLCDISKRVGGDEANNEDNPSTSRAEMTYYIDSNSWTGDDNSAGDTSGKGIVRGDEAPDSSTGTGEDDCSVTFNVARSAYNGMATLTSPTNGATGVSTNPTLRWNAPAEGANYYQVSMYPGTISGTSTTSITVSLSPSTTYQWQVRCSPDGGVTYGPWCTSWQFTTTANTPITYDVAVTITAITAIDKVDTGSNQADFYWRVAVNGVWVTSPQIYNDDSTWTGSWAGSWTLTGGSGQAYSLVIEVWDNDYEPGVMDFTYSSANDNDICDISKRAGGDDESNPSPSRAEMTYYIDSNSWTGDDNSAGDTSGKGVVKGDEAPDSSTGTGEDDCSVTFDVQRYAPYNGVATLTAPTNGATGVSSPATMRWNAPSGANYYQMSITPGTTYGTSATSISLSLNPSTTYSWKVRSSNNGGTTYGSWTSSWSFTTAGVSDSDHDGIPDSDDLNPYIDLTITVRIMSANEIEKVDDDTFYNVHNPADFYFKVTIGSAAPQYYPSGAGLYGPAENDQDYVPSFQLTSWWDNGICEFSYNCPDTLTTPTVSIVLALYDDDDGAGKTKSDQLCDISRDKYLSKTNPGKVATITYDLRTGDWGAGTGDDDGFSGDSNGIGHVSGAEVSDNSGLDCDLWFWVYQVDNDGDGKTYQEEVAQGTDPRATNPGDADADGVSNSREYGAHSKSDVKDSDGDGLLDNYEYSCAVTRDQGALSPITQNDSIPFFSNLYKHFNFENSALLQYSHYLSWNWYMSFPLYSSSVQVSTFLDGSAFEQDSGGHDLEKIALSTALQIAQGAVYTWYFPEAWPAMALATTAKICYNYILESFANACWSYWNEDWATWCPLPAGTSTTPSTRQTNAGWISQVGYGLYGNSGAGEALSGILSGLSSKYQSIASNGNKANFNTYGLQYLSEAYSLFGVMYDSAGVSGSAPYLGSFSIDGKVVINSADSSLRYYSQAEAYLCKFASNIQTWIGTSSSLLSIGQSPITTGDVASDLMKVIYDTFMLLKTERLLIESVLAPVGTWY